MSALLKQQAPRTLQEITIDSSVDGVYIWRLGKLYINDLILLSDKEKELYDLIFKDREDQLVDNYAVYAIGEAIEIIKCCPDIDEEIEYWKHRLTDENKESFKTLFQYEESIYDLKDRGE